MALTQIPSNMLASGIQSLGPNIQKLKITNGGTPNSQIAVTADALTMSNGSGLAVTATGISLTISTGSSGANGLDTGSVAVSTWYYVYAITDGTTLAGLISTSATAPTLPSGYTYKVRLGAVRTDASSVLLRTLQLGDQAQYVVTAATNTAAMPLLATGTAGSVVTPTWVAVPVGAFVPATAAEIAIVGSSTSSNFIIAAPNNGYGSYSSTTNAPPLSIILASASTNYIAQQARFILESTNIYWASVSAQLYCSGWKDNL